MGNARLDVLIVGAGPAGCATALALRAAGVERVLMVDKPITQPFRIGESATPDVSRLLAELGLDDQLGRMGHVSYQGNLSLWNGDEPQLEHFLFRGKGCGWHLDRSSFDDWLRHQAVERGVRLHRPSGIEALRPVADGWRVNVTGIGEIEARVVVDAGGRKSPLATRMGMRRHQHDELIALAVHTTAAPDMAGLSLVESFADGWWYATGLPDGRTLVTLMTDKDIAKEHGYSHPEMFMKAWRNTRLLALRCAPPSQLNGIHAFAAHSGFIECAAGSRWIAVGDALMGFDPLTSSGISGALNDALAAAPAIQAQLAGDVASARTYAQRADSTFKRYLQEHQKHYGAERRWQDKPFWRRRAATQPSPP